MLLNKLIGLLLTAVFVMGCTASWAKIATEYDGAKITVSGKLTDTNRITVKINGKTVIADWIFMSKEYVEGYYNESKVRVDCYREPVSDVSRQTICEVVIGAEKIGELFFNIVGIEY